MATPTKWWRGTESNRHGVPASRALQARPDPYGSTSPKMVGRVGVEPTKSPRSERGAFAILTTGRIGAVARSRTGTPRGTRPSSVRVYLFRHDGSDGGPGAIRTRTSPLLRRQHLPVVLRTRKWRKAGDSNPYADCSPASLFSRQVRCAFPLSLPKRI